MDSAHPDLQQAFAEAQQQRILGLGSEWGFVFADFKDHGTVPESVRDATYESYACNWVLEGSGEYITADGTIYPLTPGTFFSRFPGARHSTLLRQDQPYREFYLCMDAATYRSLRQLRLIRRHHTLHAGFNDLLLERCLRLRREVGDPRISRTQILINVIELLQAFYEQAEMIRGDEFWSAKIREARKLLSDPAHHATPLEDIARTIGAAYPSFRRAFREETGFAPGEYRIRKRLERACHLLALNPVKAVAEQLQYADPFTFSAQFKKFVGVSPSEFKRTLQSRQ